MFLHIPTTFATNHSTVKQLYSILVLLGLTVLLTGCQAKKAFKHGQELEENGLYEQAAMSYIDALRRDSEYIEALIALESVGQVVVLEKYDDFFEAVESGDDQEAIRYYQEAEDFRATLRQFNIDAARPVGHEDEYKVVLDRYVEDLYQEGRNAIGNKNYAQAEQALNEILSLNEDYKDTKNLLRIAIGRPLYNAAMVEFDQRNYRAAYRAFLRLENEVGEFDESPHYKEVALRNGQFGLGIMAFENHTDYGGVEALLSSRITRILQDKNDPFLKLIDRTMLESLTEEQIRALSGQSDPATAAEAGQLVGAKAILVGEFVSLDVRRSNLRRERRPGYLGRRVNRTNAEGERESVMVYDKVWYYDVSQDIRVSGIFQYKLVSVETGEILLTDAIDINKRDQVDYSTYNGETRYLYMGEWESMSQDRTSDRVLRTSTYKRRLDERLESRQTLQSDDELRSEIYQEMAQRAADEIYRKYLSLEG